jgi:hypothetical protein
MADVTVRVRTDGVPQILPNTAPLPDDERYVTMFTILITSAALFVSTAFPPQAVALAAGCCAAAELSLRLRARAMLRRPLAEVRSLRARRR